MAPDDDTLDECLPTAVTGAVVDEVSAQPGGLNAE